MSGLGRRFDPSEVRSDAGPGPSDAELAEALVAARELETLSARDVASPTTGFEDRVMAAIAAEPAPRLLVRPAGTVRGGVVGAFVLSVRDAWRIAMGGGRPPVVRARAMAFVLLVILATGSLSAFAAVGASSLLTTRPSLDPDRPDAHTGARRLADRAAPRPPAADPDPQPVAHRRGNDRTDRGPRRPRDRVADHGGRIRSRDAAAQDREADEDSEAHRDRRAGGDRRARRDRRAGRDDRATDDGGGGGDSSGHGGD